MRTIVAIATIFLFTGIPTKGFAYNPANINPTTGGPVKWNNTETIKYYLDPGTLGRLSNDQLHTLLKEAMKLWENASPNANVPKFEFAGYLPEDINETNYQQYLTVSPCFTNDLASCPTNAQKALQTVIIFDDGSNIINTGLCGLYACSAVEIDGVFENDSTDPKYMKQGMVVFGGGSSTKIKDVVGIMVHELGHLLGLAHPALNEAVLSDLGSYTGPDNPYRNMPTMISIGTSGDLELATLNPDDIAGISTLYPSDSFAADTATIKGQILKSDGLPMIHVNVTARNVDDPYCEAYSSLSGRSCVPSTNPQGQPICQENNSDFSLSGLPSGSYTLEVEEVAGFLAERVSPGLLGGDGNIFGDAEYWNENDAADEPNTFATVITLAPGETRSGVDIVLNRSEVTSDRVKWIPITSYTPSSETGCPSAPPVDYAALIGIDEGGGSSGTGSTTSSPSSSSGGCSLIP